MELIELKCTGCGAPMQINPNSNRAYCEYCGNVILIKDDHELETLKAELEEKDRRILEMRENEMARKMAPTPVEEYKRPAYREANDVENEMLKVVIYGVIGFAIVLLIIFVLCILTYCGSFPH